MNLKSKLFFLASGFSLLLFTAGYAMTDTTKLDTSIKSDQKIIQKNSDTQTTLTDQPLAAYQNELLDLAFKSATMIPVKPLIKDRSRAQAEVVEVSLKLDQPQRALGYIEKIDNWLRGASYADLAVYSIQHGEIKDVQHYLDLAGKISETTEDWRRDNIKVKIAQVQTLLGKNQEAEKLEKGVEASEKGKLAKTKAMVSDKESFDQQIKEMDALIASENFDVIKNALESSTELFNRFYDDKDKRSLVEKKIKASWEKMPLFIRIDLMEQLVGFALDHKDKKTALSLVNETQKMMDGAQWPVQYRVPMAAKLADFRFRAGDIRKAKLDADVTLALYKAKGKGTIVNIYRAEALRPLAESYQTMGDTKKAIDVYKMAVEEGYENPNSRPRAEDLSATCISMALHKVEPDAQLWSRIREIHQGLASPW